MRLMTAFVGMALLSLSASAVDWENVDEDHYLAGRKCSNGYLQGKVTLVCRDAALADRMEEIWSSFKTKPFVLIGAYAAAPEKKPTYPVYNGATISGDATTTPIFVTDCTGKMRYKGADERKATEVLVTLLTDMESPKTEAQWRYFLDYEMANMPGRAYLRYADFKKKFPKSVKDYAEKYAEMMKMARVKDLSELVKFAKSVKDLKAIPPKKARMIKSRLSGRIDDAVTKYASLKESDYPLVVREAKNALADLAWAKAALQQ